jgi:hypothetical protein
MVCSDRLSGRAVQTIRKNPADGKGVPSALTGSQAGQCRRDTRSHPRGCENPFSILHGSAALVRGCPQPAALMWRPVFYSSWISGPLRSVGPGVGFRPGTMPSRIAIALHPRRFTLGGRAGAVGCRASWSPGRCRRWGGAPSVSVGYPVAGCAVAAAVLWDRLAGRFHPRAGRGQVGAGLVSWSGPLRRGIDGPVVRGPVRWRAVSARGGWPGVFTRGPAAVRLAPVWSVGRDRCGGVSMGRLSAGRCGGGPFPRVAVGRAFSPAGRPQESAGSTANRHGIFAFSRVGGRALSSAAVLRPSAIVGRIAREAITWNAHSNTGRRSPSRPPPRGPGRRLPCASFTGPGRLALHRRGPPGRRGRRGRRSRWRRRRGRRRVNPRRCRPGRRRRRRRCPCRRARLRR